MEIRELVQKIIELVGSQENITSVTNCMTRLRIKVKDDSKIKEEALKSVEGVLGVVHDRSNYVEVVVGPGNSSKCGEICRELGIPAEEQGWQEKKEAAQAAQKDSSVRNALKVFGEIFVPLIPGIIAAGLCAGINTLIQQSNPGWADDKLLKIICTLLGLINTSLLSYLTAWTGYRTAERFGGTPILGGMLGMITGLEGINTIAQAIGWWNYDSPLDSTLRVGRGGVLAVVVGVLIMVKVEKWVRKHMPNALDTFFTPVITLVVCLVPYVFVIMPILGLVSSGISMAVQSVCMSPNIWVRAITGYISAAVYLPLVTMGMHHGLVAIHSVQLEELGYVTLYPALCMAGAGQVGTALAIYLKAKKVNNARLMQVIRGAVPTGILGIGEPLIYGVTLPMGKPFITAGLGAGFAGAWIMITQVAATTWGPSGILGIFIMTAGPNAGIKSVLFYLVGLLIANVMAFIITTLFVTDDEVRNA